MYKSLNWVALALGAIALLLGFISWVAHQSLPISPRAYILLSISFFMIAANFSLLRIILLREKS